MGSTWLVSDTHFGHANVIKFCDRPFSSPHEMDLQMIERWRDLVQPDDDVFHLGDFSFHKREETERIISLLPGRIHLVYGNHDKMLQNTGLRSKFASVQDYLEIKVADTDAPGGWQRIVLCHFAFRVWNQSHYGAWNLHGHSHGSLTAEPHMRQLDVGVDVINFAPIQYNAVKWIMAEKTWKPVDYHEERK